MKKNKEIILIISWVLLTIAILFIFILPNMRKMISISERIQENKKRYEQMKQSGQNKKEAEANYQLIKENISTIDGILLKSGEELAFITTLEEIASINNLEQKMNIFISDKNKSDTSQTKTGETISLPFQLTLDGNFYSFFSYLIDLEESNYYLNIQKIQFTQSQSPVKNNFEEENISPGDNNIHVILDGVSYWQ